MQSFFYHSLSLTSFIDFKQIYLFFLKIPNKPLKKTVFLVYLNIINVYE